MAKISRANLPEKVLARIFAEGRKFFDTRDPKMVMRLRKMQDYGYVREVHTRTSKADIRFVPTVAGKSLLALIEVAMHLKNDRDELRDELDALKKRKDE